MAGNHLSWPDDGFKVGRAWRPCSFFFSGRAIHGIFLRRRPSMKSGKGLILKRDVQDSQRWSWPGLGRSEMAVKVIGSWAPEPSKQRRIIFFFVAGGLGRGFGRRHCFDRGRGPEGCSVDLGWASTSSFFSDGGSAPLVFHSALFFSLSHSRGGSE